LKELQGKVLRNKIGEAKMDVKELSSQPSENLNKEVSVESLMKEIQELKASKQRILDESKGYKSKFQEASSTLDVIEREKLEKEGKTDEILLKEREEKSKLMDNLKDLKNKTLRANIMSALSSSAKDAHSIDDLLSLKSASMIEFDEDSLMPVKDTVETFLNSVREEKPYLFGSKRVAPMLDGKPSGEKPKPKTRSLEDALKGVISR